jgi:hypothetical protein
MTMTTRYEGPVSDDKKFLRRVVRRLGYRSFRDEMLDSGVYNSTLGDRATMVAHWLHKLTSEERAAYMDQERDVDDEEDDAGDGDGDANSEDEYADRAYVEMAAEEEEGEEEDEDGDETETDEDVVIYLQARYADDPPVTPADARNAFRQEGFGAFRAGAATHGLYRSSDERVKRLRLAGHWLHVLTAAQRAAFRAVEAPQRALARASRYVKALAPTTFTVPTMLDWEEGGEYAPEESVVRAAEANPAYHAFILDMKDRGAAIPDGPRFKVFDLFMANELVEVWSRLSPEVVGAYKLLASVQRWYPLPKDTLRELQHKVRYRLNHTGEVAKRTGILRDRVASRRPYIV